MTRTFQRIHSKIRDQDHDLAVHGRYVHVAPQPGHKSTGVEWCTVPGEQHFAIARRQEQWTVVPCPYRIHRLWARCRPSCVENHYATAAMEHGLCVARSAGWGLAEKRSLRLSSTLQTGLKIQSLRQCCAQVAMSPPTVANRRCCYSFRVNVECPDSRT